MSNDDFSEYKDLIRQIEETPRVDPPADLIGSVMKRMADEQNLSIRLILCRTLAQAGEISWTRFISADTQERDTCFHFFLAGLFFFFIGLVLFSSSFFIGGVSIATGFILLQSILVLMASVSLMTGGIMTVTDIPNTARWAKRAITIYGMLMILSAVIIAAVVRTNFGGLLAIIFGLSGIITGIILTRVLENRARENKGNITGEMHNA